MIEDRQARESRITGVRWQGDCIIIRTADGSRLVEPIDPSFDAEVDAMVAAKLVGLIQDEVDRIVNEYDDDDDDNEFA